MSISISVHASQINSADTTPLSSHEPSTDQFGQQMEAPVELSQGEPLVRKRRRTINSCAGCRKRKSRCDRGQPCSECVTNSTLDLCHYLSEVVKQHSNPVLSLWRNGSSPTPPLSTQSDISRDTLGHDSDLAARVSQLENLVRGQMSLLNQGKPQPKVEPSQIERPSGPSSLPSKCERQRLEGFIRSDKLCTVVEMSKTVAGAPFGDIGKLPGRLQGSNGRETKFMSSRHWSSLLNLASDSSFGLMKSY
jgi:hypothetical protein